jgi:hypothetical protein
MTPIEKEKLMVLSGERGRVEDHAMRKGAAIALVTALDSAPTSRAIDAAPTREQYNALVDDLNALYGAVNAMRIALTRG